MQQASNPGDGAKISIGTIAFASAIGTTIEWYDFFLYNTMTALVLNKLFFPNVGHPDFDASGLCHVLRRLFVAADRRCHFRSLRRPRRAQDRAHSDGPDHGHRDLPDRTIANLRHGRRVGADHASGTPHIPGHRHRRRMGRRGADGSRTFSRRTAWLLRKLATDRRAGRSPDQRRRRQLALAPG